MEAGSGLAAFVAGLLTALNPCVLPLLPIVFAAAISKHRIAGPLALAAGLVVSFVTIGFVLALAGQTVTGLGAERLRPIGGVILILIGVVLLVPQIQEALQRAAGPATNWFNSRFGGAGGGGWAGQFGLGVVLGLVWSPCVGPTIGVASSMAYSGENLGAMVGILLIFAIGAAIPLVVIGFLSRTVMMRWRDRLARIAAIGRIVLGVLMITIGVLILTGLDRRLEGWLGSVLPVWLVDLTVRY
ncbi:MAG: cytochrome c biogenesis CcdA family protein [Bauldia sp.]